MEKIVINVTDGLKKIIIQKSLNKSNVPIRVVKMNYVVTVIINHNSLNNIKIRIITTMMLIITLKINFLGY